MARGNAGGGGGHGPAACKSAQLLNMGTARAFFTEDGPRRKSTGVNNTSNDGSVLFQLKNKSLVCFEIHHVKHVSLGITNVTSAIGAGDHRACVPGFYMVKSKAYTERRNEFSLEILL